jgi:hypothetical protein
VEIIPGSSRTRFRDQPETVRLHPGIAFTLDRIPHYGVAESELLAEITVLRRVQGTMSYKFRIGLDVNKEVNGNA